MAPDPHRAAHVATVRTMLQAKAADSVWWLTMVDHKTKRESAIAYGDDYSVADDKCATVYALRGVETLQSPPREFAGTLTLCKTGRTAIGMKLTCTRWGSKLTLTGQTDGNERVRLEAGK